MRRRPLTGMHSKQKDPAMKRDDVFPSKYFRGADFAQPKVLTIDVVHMELLKTNGKEESKPVAYFKKAKKALVLNRTNFDAITDIAGDDDYDNWPDTRIELYSVMQEVRGEMKNCVRVRAPQAELSLEPKKAKAKTGSKPKPSIQDDMDDEVPFTR